MSDLTGFAAFALSASATPGPNNVMLTALGASVGIRRGLPALFGIAFGFAVMIFLISIGLGQAIVRAGPAATLAMRITGIAILAWLAWQIATAPIEEKDQYGELGADAVPKFRSFFGAAAFQWVNPKAWIICASAIAAYLDVVRDILPQAMMFSFTFVFAGLVGCLPWLAAGKFAGRYLRGQRARIFNIVMAVLLLLSVLRVMF